MNSRIGYICSAIALAALLASGCRKDMVFGTDAPDEGLRLRSIAAVIDNGQAGTKAHDKVEPLRDSLDLGRHDFVAGDQIFFTRIERSVNPMAMFTYPKGESSPISFTYSADRAWDAAEGQDDIYWTDASSPHTFIAYSIPQQPAGQIFKWEHTAGSPRYDGQVHFTGDYVDYTSDSGVGGLDGWAKLRQEDLLIAYSENQEHEGQTATIQFRHALSSVRVKIALSGFYTSTQDKDHLAKVLSASITGLPTAYYWAQESYAAKMNSESPVNKNMKLFCPRPDGDTERISETQERQLYTFTYYGITVPHDHSGLALSFEVTYPDPKNDNGPWIKKTYVASLASVKFMAGFCTSITVTLNHQDDEITIGADYTDWEYVDTPDEGELSKNTTFLMSASRDVVTTHWDSDANADDATWLYKSGDDILDIYGNDGSEETPYVIKTADQFLSFAYEVYDSANPDQAMDFTGKFINLDAGLYLQNSTSGKDVLWPGIGTEDHPFNGNLNCGMRIIKRLKGKPLFGFLGPLAHVEQLRLQDVLQIEGAAAFAQYNQGIICGAEVSSPAPSSGEQFVLNVPLTLEGLREDETDNPASITFSTGTSPNRTGGTTTIASPIVAFNEGVVMTSFCKGSFTATGARRTSGIVGYDKGAMVVCYSAVNLKSTASDAFYRGTVAYNRYDPSWIRTDRSSPYSPRQHSGEPSGTAGFGALTYCFFDYDVAKLVDHSLAMGNVYAKTTAQMQSNKFIGSRELLNENQETLNGSIHKWAGNSNLMPHDLQQAYWNYYVVGKGMSYSAILSQFSDHFKSHYYEFHVADYPWVY